MGIPISTKDQAPALIETHLGRPYQLQGTWVHPRVAVHLGQWLLVEFQVWVTGIIDDWREMQKLLRPTPTDWTKQFPDEFYEGIARLHGWPWRGRSMNPPQIVGHYTNDLVWDRLAPGLRHAIELRIPRLPSGEHKERMHQMLAAEVGIRIAGAHGHTAPSGGSAVGMGHVHVRGEPSVAKERSMAFAMTCQRSWMVRTAAFLSVRPKSY